MEIMTGDGAAQPEGGASTHIKDSGIEIPFPQRDLHIRSDARKAAEP